MSDEASPIFAGMIIFYGVCIGVCGIWGYITALQEEIACLKHQLHYTREINRDLWDILHSAEYNQEAEPNVINDE